LLEGHLSQLLAPVQSLYVPASHETHVCVPLSLCALVLYLPSAHIEQRDEPYTENRPGVQRSHDTALTESE
jgi:hypothetical protein